MLQAGIQLFLYDYIILTTSHTRKKLDFFPTYYEVDQNFQ